MEIRRARRRTTRAAVSVCPTCTVVAGGMLDDGELQSYLARYQSALAQVPAVWGLHNYYDSTYFQTQGVDTMLARTSGSLWLTETGALWSNGDVQPDPRDQQSMQWLYTLAAGRPRIARMYMYQWQGDAALQVRLGTVESRRLAAPRLRGAGRAGRPARRAAV